MTAIIIMVTIRYVAVMKYILRKDLEKNRCFNVNLCWLLIIILSNYYSLGAITFIASVTSVNTMFQISHLIHQLFATVTHIIVILL